MPQKARETEARNAVKIYGKHDDVKPPGSQSPSNRIKI